jgi:hypothetical protein
MNVSLASDSILSNGRISSSLKRGPVWSLNLLKFLIHLAFLHRADFLMLKDEVLLRETGPLGWEYIECYARFFVDKVVSTI